MVILLVQQCMYPGERRNYTSQRCSYRQEYLLAYWQVDLVVNRPASCRLGMGVQDRMHQGSFHFLRQRRVKSHRDQSLCVDTCSVTTVIFLNRMSGLRIVFHSGRKRDLFLRLLMRLLILGSCRVSQGMPELSNNGNHVIIAIFHNPGRFFAWLLNDGGYHFLVSILYFLFLVNVDF